uniref:Uncharacterized protein n=1 Tax=Anguilla anguilla TaxID=7936 RepID=A0A0E9VJ18_ANGAN
MGSQQYHSANSVSVMASCSLTYCAVFHFYALPECTYDLLVRSD